MRGRYSKFVITVGILLLWEYGGGESQTIRILLSSPSRIGSYLSIHYVDLLLATIVTASEAAAGLLMAATCSFSLAVVCLYFPRFLNVILPFLVSVQVIPLVVFAPFIIIILGIGFASKAGLAAIIAFFPVFINFLSGYQAISPNVHDLLDIYNTPKTFRIFHIFIPLAAPTIFAGLKISATLSALGAIVAEFTGASIGIGKNIFLTTVRIEPELMVLSVVLCGSVGGFLYYVVDRCERILGRWYL